MCPARPLAYPQRNTEDPKSSQLASFQPQGAQWHVRLLLVVFDSALSSEVYRAHHIHSSALWLTLGRVQQR